MQAIVKFPFVISFIFAAFVFLSNAQKPQKLGIAMWTDASKIAANRFFFGEQLCPHLDKIDWDKTDIDFRFGVQAQKDPSGALHCALSNTDCTSSLVCLCAKRHCKDTAQLFKFFCCSLSVDECLREAGIDVPIGTIAECANNPATAIELIGGWDAVKSKFPQYMRLPVFLVNNDYNKDTDAELKDGFFKELCKLFPPSQVGKYCPANF